MASETPNPDFTVRVLESLGGFVYVYDLAEERNIFISPRWAEEL